MPLDRSSSAGSSSDAAALQAEADALVAVLQRAPRHLILDDADVRAAVLRYAACARAVGLPPERFIVRIKNLVRDEGAADVGPWYREVVTDRIVVWAIEGYYRVLDAGAD